MSFHSLVQRIRQGSKPACHKPRRPQIRVTSLEDRVTPAVGNILFPTLTSSNTEGSGAQSITVELRTDDQNLVGNVSVNAVDSTPRTATTGSDYTYSTQTVTFTPGDPFTLSGGQRTYAKTISITLPTDDRRVEGTEFTSIVLDPNSLTLNGDSVNLTAGNSTHTANILDNDSATASVTGTSGATEGGATGLIPITLTLNLTGSGTDGLDVPISINLTGPSLGTDYTLPASPMATFATGDFTSRTTGTAGAPATPVVTAVDDLIVEGPETFAITPVVQSSGGATVTTSGTNTLTITDNDTAELSIPTATTSVTEGGSTANIPVTLTITANGVAGTGTLGVAVTADLSGAAQGDFTTTPASFPAGSASGTANIVVAAVNDTIVEGTESFTPYVLTLPTPNPANPAITVAGSGTQTIQVTDNDTAAITISGTSTANEGGSAASVGVTLTITANGSTTSGGTLGKNVSVDLGPAGADYTLPTAPMVTFTAGTGNSTQTATVAAVDDQTVEGNESFPLSLSINSDPTGQVTVSGTNTLTVTDNDTAVLTLDPATQTVLESVGTTGVTAKLSISAIGTGTVQLGYALTANLTSGGSNGTDYNLPGSPMFTFPALSASGDTKTATVTINNDQIIEGPETFTFAVTGITTAGSNMATQVSTTGSHDVTITDNDTATLSIANGTTTVTEGGASGTVPVTLTLTANGVAGQGSLGVAVSADLSGAAQGDFTTTPASFPSGVSSGTTANITVSAVDDLIVEGTESFTPYTLAITPSGNPAITVAGTSGTQAIQVTDNDTAAITITGTSTAAEGGAGATVGVTLTVTANGSTTSGGTLGKNVTVDLTGPSAGTDYTLPTAPMVTFASGAGNGTTNVTAAAVNDQLVEGNESFALSLTGLNDPTGQVTTSGTNTLTVTDNDTATLTFTPASQSVAETAGVAPVTATLTINGNGTGTAALGYALTADLTNGTPNSNGTDYNVPATPMFSFLAGDGTGVTSLANVAIVNDTLIEGSETFTFGFTGVTTAGSNMATQIVSTDTHALTITDNDTASITFQSATSAATEGGANATIVAVLNTTGGATLQDAVTVNLTPAGADYTFPASPVFTFAAGSGNGATSSASVAAVDDLLVETTTEAFALSFTAPAGTGSSQVSASGTNTLTVTDNDFARVSIATAVTQVTEGQAGKNLPVTLTITANGSTTSGGTLDKSLSVALSPGDDDYTSTGLTFAAGAGNQTGNIVVTAVDDRRVEPSPESILNQVLVTTAINGMDAAVDGSSGKAQIDIVDNDRAQITYSGNVTVSEGSAATQPVTATLALITSGSGVEQLDTAVSATVSSPTNDFAATTVTWPGGGSPNTQTIDIGAIDDQTVEQATETLVGVLTPTTAASVEVLGSVTVNVTDNDSATVNITAPGTTAVTEGGAAKNVGVTLTLITTGTTGAPTLGVPVSANLPGNADYTATAAVFNPGSGTGSVADIAVSAVQDNVVEPLETFAGQALAVSSTGAATATGGSQTVTVTDDDVATFTINDATATESILGSSVVFTVSLDKAIEGIPFSVTVSFGGGSATPGIDYTATSQTVTFAAGSTTPQTVSVPVLNDFADELAETFIATLTPATALGGRSVSTSDTGTGTIIDDDNGSPVVTPRSFTLAEDTSISSTLTGTDPEGNTLTFAIVAQPANGTVNLVAATGDFTYTPNANYFGPDSFTYKANDGNSDSNVATVSITVTPVNDAPTANNGTLTTNEDTAASGTVVAIDPDGNVLTYSVVTGPAHGTLTSFNTATGAYTYTPASNYNGPDSFTFKANDGTVDSNTGIVSITVNAVNDAPVANPASHTINEDSTLTGSVTATDVDGDTLTYSLVSGVAPAAGTVTVSSNGTFVYTPAANFNGVATFTFKANDGALDSNTATVTITVNAVNDAPVANNGTLGTAEDTAASGFVTSSDVDGPAPTYTITSGPAHGTLTSFNAATGAYTYTPASNYNGPDTFSFTASDGSLTSNTGTVSITVTAVNDAPVANPLATGTSEDTPLVGNVSGSDVDGDPLTFAVVTPPTNGSVTVSSNGTFNYVPNANYFGPDSFTFKVNDGTVDSPPATVTITVAPVNDAPVANNGTLGTAEDTAASGFVTSSDVDGPAPTYTITSGPAHGTLTSFNAATGAYTYTPASNYNGPDTFSFTASDGSLTSNTGTVSITVTAVNDAPVANPQSASVPEDTTLTGSVSGSDVDGDPLTFTRVSGPSNGSLTLASNGTFVYVPNSNYNGPDSFTFVANDGTVNSAPATVSITVLPVNDAPVANNQTLSTNEDQPVNGTLTSSDIDGPAPTYTILTAPSHGTISGFNAATGAFTYTPTADFNGTDTFTFKANDGSLDSNTATVVITVVPVNDAPVLADDAIVPPILQATTNPPGRKISSMFDSVVTDEDDGDTLAGIAVTANPQNADQGTWQYSVNDGATWVNIGPASDVAAVALSANTKVRFLPAPFFFGDPTPLTVRALDSTYAGAFSGATPVLIPTTPNGGTTAISADAKKIHNPVFQGDVPGAWLSTTGNLFVAGTAGKDNLAVSRVIKRLPGGVRETHIVVKLNGKVIGDFLDTAITGRIYVRGFGGDDRITIPATITKPTEVYGGSGNDFLSGGAGADRLFGEGGNDRIIGGKGNDLLEGGAGDDTLSDTTGLNVLIGGAGKDRLIGGIGEDLLIAGAADAAADLSDLSGLINIMNEWTGGNAYATKVTNLTNGVGAESTKLTDATITDGVAAEVVTGGRGADWYLVGADDKFKIDTKLSETQTGVN